VQPAERTNFEAGTFDLVAVAQALHWFDYERFWPEVRRVAKPGAFFCAWGYAWTEGPAELHEALLDPLVALLEPYWAPNNGILWRGYRSEEICFPFERLEAPASAIELDWSISELLGYVRTWSAWTRSQSDEKVVASMSRLEAEALRLFAGTRMPLKMPLAVAAGRIG
jgi:SAM-dependent methyltransferase